MPAKAVLANPMHIVAIGGFPQTGGNSVCTVEANSGSSVIGKAVP